MQGCRSHQRQRGCQHVPHAARDPRQHIDGPHCGGAHEENAGIVQGQPEHSPAGAKSLINFGGRAPQREQQRCRQPHEHRVPRKTYGLPGISRTQRASHRRCGGAAERAGGHLQHQHGNRQHDGDARQGVCTQLTDDVAVIADQDRGGEQAEHVRCGQPQQRGQHRPHEHALRGGRRARKRRGTHCTGSR